MRMDLARSSHRPKRVGKVFPLLNIANKPAINEYPCTRHPQSLVDIIYALYSQDRKSTRLNSSHANISYAVFCLKKKNKISDTIVHMATHVGVQANHQHRKSTRLNSSHAQLSYAVL